MKLLEKAKLEVWSWKNTDAHDEYRKEMNDIILNRLKVGKTLFYKACEEAKKLGADKLYISAHSSRESQAAYKAIGCVHAEEINRKLAEEEPCDVQLEYVLV